MSEPDKYLKDAEALVGWSSRANVVAARLRSDGQEIDRLRTAITDAGIHDWTQYKNEITSLRDELSQLRAAMSQAKGER